MSPQPFELAAHNGERVLTARRPKSCEGCGKEYEPTRRIRHFVGRRAVWPRGKRSSKGCRSTTTAREVASMRILLSPHEQAIVLRPVNGRGGFQSLLRRIQCTWEPRTATLEVSKRDLERILRELGRGGPSGGFRERLAALDPCRTMARSALRVVVSHDRWSA